MKTLKLLNKKNLSIIFLIFLGSISQAEDQPVDIWNIDKKKLDVNSLSKDTVDEVEKKIKQKSVTDIYNMQSQKKNKSNRA